MALGLTEGADITGFLQEDDLTSTADFRLSGLSGSGLRVEDDNRSKEAFPLITVSCAAACIRQDGILSTGSTESE